MGQCKHILIIGTNLLTSKRLPRNYAKHFSIKSSLMAPSDDWIHEKGIAKCSHRFVEAKGLLKMFMQSCCICTKSIGIKKNLQCTGNN